VKLLRDWSVRHSRGLHTVYNAFEGLLTRLDPLLRRIGHHRLEKPVSAVEDLVKGLLFDSQGCGQCTLSETGMACPMNCPKTLRNGPCGGVRQNGACEVKPDMTCVWVRAWEGSQQLEGPEAGLQVIQQPLDYRRKGQSSWLHALRQKRERRA